ncbi:MAG: L-seryl-tRNA(Sec) selenium transferase [Deltaproteobacteria bacterium]|nr:L-seryl-tRNA(Sec) selenium transferase [Deltaproteobacteria bacterium]
MNNNLELRKVPSVESLLVDPLFKELIHKYSRQWLTETIRLTLERCRKDILSGKKISLSSQCILDEVNTIITDSIGPSLKKVINATGTVIHTNLGRSLLPEEAIEHIRLCASEPVNLEYDIQSGHRGERDDHIENLICRLTGAEAATVVNNNAAAVLIVLNTLSKRKEVIVSRGELVEIGGSFRIPDIIKSSACKLLEVGTTNRTRLSDYENAISKKTGALLKVHTSNYRIEGFTESVPLQKLGNLSSTYSLPLIEDLGSGSLFDLSGFDLPNEPLLSDSIKEGAHLVTFSGDKLLGGPQCGIIAGKKSLIKKINKNPLKRALRIDKIRLAALESLLKIYLTDKRPFKKVPTLRYLTRSIDELNSLAVNAQEKLSKKLSANIKIEITKTLSEPGSGSLPGESIPSLALAIKHKKLSAGKIASIFRMSNPPIIGRIYKNTFLLDLRCIDNVDDIVPNTITPL